ncbi:protein of unknown function [Candidatus Hydrogenisulfobacillus filiaventi]|uniref:Uncharacterized protein n=1 Tax=Candidatus Hydrogenisulfobacillus filiaventi TaxID=2707344 RepID=A0A6F8ZJ05_9FIRM|nr:protein of unknown function [Candidatus Hydrogenisulfobacillus filiaventi]
MAGRGIPDHRRGLTAIGAVLLAAAALAGCGAPALLHGAGTAPRYAKDGLPINRAALEAKYGKVFPGLVLRAPGAPKTPPFSLAPYPANHAILWRSGIDVATLPAWEVQGAETAARWMIMDNDNHPLSPLAVMDTAAPVQSGLGWRKIGVRTQGEEEYWQIADLFKDFAQPVPGTHTPAGGYEYRTWAEIEAVEPASAWAGSAARREGAAGPAPVLPTMPGYLARGQRATRAETVFVASWNVYAGGGIHHDRGDYGYGMNGPTPVLVADVRGLGWRVIATGGAPGTVLRRFPQHYAVPRSG